MLNKIPWYVALFQSLPESFLILKLGLILFKIDLGIKETFIISAVVAVVSYLIRLYFTIFGIHTLLTLILLIILARVIGKIRLVHATIGVLIGVLITGILQSLTVPGLLDILELSVDDLGILPMLNIVLFIPSAFIMSLAYLFIKKKDFCLIDFNNAYKD